MLMAFSYKVGALGGVATGDYTLEERRSSAWNWCRWLHSSGRGAAAAEGARVLLSSAAGNTDPAWATYTPHISHKVGALGGEDLEAGSYTLHDARLHSLKIPACVGFTYQGVPNQQGKVQCYQGSAAGNADPNWQTYLKAPGAQLTKHPHLPTAAPTRPTNLLPAFSYKVGALGGGNDVATGDYTLEEAALKCLELGAAGFTHQGVTPQPQQKVRVFFKSSAAGNTDPAWATYTPHISHKVGALGGGNDLEAGSYTLHDAWLHSLKIPACVGFTCQGVPNQQGKVQCYFKSFAAGNADRTGRHT